VLESYTWRATAQRTADWYADVLGRKSLGRKSRERKSRERKNTTC